MSEIQSFRGVEQSNFEMVAKNIQAIQGDKLDFPSLLYLISNINLNNKIGESIQLDIFEKLNSCLSYFTEKNSSLIQIIIGLHILIILGSVSAIKRINTYELKVLLIVTRVKQSEATEEIHRLRRIVEIISVQEKELWLEIDFTNMSQKMQVKDRTKQSKQFKKEQNLTSMIRNMQIGIWPKMMVIITMCVLSTIFFSIIVIVGNNLSKNLAEPIYFYQQAIKTYSSFTAAISYSEIISSYSALRQYDPHLPLFNITDQMDHFKTEMEKIHEFTFNFTLMIRNLPNKLELEQLFENDVCKLFPNEVQCTLSMQETFSKGMAGYLSRFLSLMQQYDELMSSNLQGDAYRLILFEYLQEKDHLHLIVLNYSLPQVTFLQTIEQAHSSVHFFFDSFIIFSNGYLFVFSLCFLLSLIIISRILFKNYQNDLKLINFSLYLLPHKKIREDNTKHLLKQLILY